MPLLRLLIGFAAFAAALAFASSSNAAIALRSSTSNATTLPISDSFQISAPGTSPGDVMLAVVSVRMQDSGGTIATPAGWTLVQSDTSGVAPGPFVQRVYARVAGASEPRSWNFPLLRASSASGGILAFSGVDTAASVDASSGQFAANTASIVAPGVSTTAAGDRLVAFFGHTSPGTITAPASMVGRWSLSSVNSHNVTSAAADESWPTVGASGSRTATASAVRQSTVGQLIALRPAATPPPTPAPVISNVRVHNATPFSVLVSWVTDRPATSRLELGTTTSYGLWSAGDQTPVTSHSITVSDLHWATAYHARPLSSTSGGTTAGPDTSFATASLQSTRRTTTVSARSQILLDGHPFFPVMQFLQCPLWFDTNVALGIDTFMGRGCQSKSDSQELADTASRNALSILQFNSGVVNAPSLLGWRFVDEPDGNGVYPAQIQSQYSANRSADPGHLNFLTLTPNFFSQLSPPSWMNGDRSIYKQYTAAADVPGFDIYPIYGWCRPDLIWWEADATREFATMYAPAKPIYSWIEAASTSSQWCTGRGVYDYEVRAEVWMTITNGAKAVGYFTHSWNPDYSQFRVSPEVQSEMRRTNRQIRNLAPALLAPPASVSRQVLTAGGRVDFIARTYAGATYVFAVNVNRSNTAVRFSAPWLAGAEVRVWEESRTLSADASGSFTDTFSPLAVHIYVVPPAKASSP